MSKYQQFPVCVKELIVFFLIMTELIRNFLAADDPLGTHKGFPRVAV